MNIQLDKHPAFTSWTDPTSGVTSYVLTDSPAPLSKVFYFNSPGYTGESPWLWFHVAYPPCNDWFAAAINLDQNAPDLRLFPGVKNNSQTGEHPLMIEGGQAILSPMGKSIYRIDINGSVDEVFRLPAELIKTRHVFRVCTGVSRSIDGQRILLDANIGNRWEILLVDLTTGDWEVLQSFANKHHHTWFSPVDPDLFLIAQGPGNDPLTGTKNSMNIRMWLMNTQGNLYEPLFDDLWFGKTAMNCHEWWTADGLVSWCDYNDGVYETRVDDGPRKRELVWKRPLIHAHCDPKRRLYVGDYNPYTWNDRSPCSVWFYDRESGNETCIANALPEPQQLQYDVRRGFHIDPHPHITDDGQWIIYTTTVLGQVSIALTPVQELIS